jgi:hypothetical protein
MGRKRNVQGSIEAARQLIRRLDVFHDPLAIARGGTGLEYIPEKLIPRKNLKRRARDRDRDDNRGEDRD